MERIGPLTLRVHDLRQAARPRRSTSIYPMKDAPARAMPFARAWSEGESWAAGCREFCEGKGSAHPARLEVSRSRPGGELTYRGEITSFVVLR
jgi:hypothetical protein